MAFDILSVYVPALVQLLTRHKQVVVKVDNVIKAVSKPTPNLEAAVYDAANAKQPAYRP